MIKHKLFTILLIVTILSIISSCKKDKDENTTSKAKYVLIIENPPQSITPDKQITYYAHLVNASGIIITPSSIVWSSSKTDVATISSSGLLTISGCGNTTIEATVKEGDFTYQAVTPLRVANPSVFSVLPSALLNEKDGSLQLESFALSSTGIIEPTCVFESSNSSVATVSNTGLVSFVDVGECTITVTANSISGNPTITVPVIVIDKPKVVIPVSKIEITPPYKNLFKGETVQLIAEAYKSYNSNVNISYLWSSSDTSIATVTQTGIVTPVKQGNAFINAMAYGVIGQTEIIVNPDTFIIVNPYVAYINDGDTIKFTATPYQITRTSGIALTGININWNIPNYGISSLDIASVDATGLVSLNSNTVSGSSNIIFASDNNNPDAKGVGIISVAYSEDCNCGAGNSLVDTIIVLNPQPVQIYVSSPYPLNVNSFDNLNNAVLEPNLVYCSDNIQVVDVDDNGQLIAINPGNATITICSGNYTSTTVKIQVLDYNIH